MVAIKDMEMPKNCKHCTRKPICKVYALMFLNEPYSFNKDERPDGCPLVEIITCKDCNQVNCSYHAETCDPEEYRPDFYCGNAKRRQ